MGRNFGMRDPYVRKRVYLEDEIQRNRAEKMGVSKSVGIGVILGFFGGTILGENLTDPFEYLSNSTEEVKYVWTFIGSIFGGSALGGLVGGGIEYIHRRFRDS
jgi:hypothetical protein